MSEIYRRSDGALVSEERPTACAPTVYGRRGVAGAPAGEPVPQQQPAVEAAPPDPALLLVVADALVARLRARLAGRYWDDMAQLRERLADVERWAAEGGRWTAPRRAGRVADGDGRWRGRNPP